MKICIITDNQFAYENIVRLIRKKDFKTDDFDFFCSDSHQQWIKAQHPELKEIKLNEQGENFYGKYNLFISLHSKQIFPKDLVDKHRCINIHPGYNPYNRGWYPHAFSIINGKPTGVTIHEMDSKLDHGRIIYQEEVEIYSWDTSGSLYARIQQKEKEMINKYLKEIIQGNYTSIKASESGNINNRKDYQSLCAIELEKPATYGEVIDLLRATTFPPYVNAYYYDENGEKIYISIQIKRGERS